MPMQEYEVINEMEHRGYKIQSMDPFGFWKIVNEEGKGMVPKALSGRYTTLPDATMAIDTFMAKVEMEMRNKNHVNKQVEKNKERENTKAEEEHKAQLEEKIKEEKK